MNVNAMYNIGLCYTLIQVERKMFQFGKVIKIKALYYFLSLTKDGRKWVKKL